ncbi:sigma-54-dependent transcriptional regulator [Paraliomyxa miuraensis]|uniref:sigma-54-dependent transcriptional regulator n=1 Tax=Paraliomyxa miuraensis TaxID=376150 RepID=UPI002253749F|nr:sigma-54 dependent transcriptional regulator [Paraliomyxa miuraensis]MCX4247435.1 sigma-54 dependent transcriptional regulator [Paraliomyxa miuraensis]
MASILVVDDEEGIRSFLAEALLDEGHHVEQAADGEQALRALARHGFEVVLTDLKMPHLDGMGLLERLRRDQPEVEVIVLTAHGTVDTALQAMKLGAFDYLQKPLSSPAELRLLVARAAERYRLRGLAEAARSEDAPRLSHGAPAMVEVESALRKVAPTEATVLLLGESGTGKEVAARAVHAWSRRAEGPFVAINCAALSENLLESELFGHEKGAFTGAAARRRGRIELAQHGTFFLDEVGELAPALQAKLLRVLQERCFERVGGTQTLRADVRWVAATNRDLLRMVSAGSFREDLYHRLAVFPVQLPPLRERPEDIAPLAESLLHRVAASLGRPYLRLDPSAVTVLRAASWPGNVRELANALERAAILADDDRIMPEHLVMPGAARPGAATAPPTTTPSTVPAAPGRTLAELEREAIEQALARHDGNRRRAAEQLGIGVRTLYDKLKRYELG